MYPILRLLCVFLLPYSATAQLTGNWYGILEAGAQRIPLDLAFTQAAGELTGSLLSPAQNPARIPFTTVAVADDSVTFSITAVGLRYGGTITGDRIRGAFSQGAFSTPLTFYREKPAGYDELLAPRQTERRPQDPTDFPYRREAVRFAGGAAGVMLAGELTLPQGEPPKAALVLVTGSGPQDRNEDLGPAVNHRPFLVLSDRLTRAGYAVLRYDDRGAGESTGDHGAATSADLAADAAAAVAFLRENLTDPATPVGIAGHSEGGMIGPMVAADDPNVDFLVLLAAPGLPIAELMAEQRAMIGQSPLANEAVLAAATAYLKAHPDQEDAVFRRSLRDTLLSLIPSLPAPVRESIVDPETFANTYVDGLSAPWMRYFLAYDPGPTLAHVTVPVLALNGEKDTQVSPRNLDAVGAALARAGNDDVTLERFPTLNHLFQPAETGLPDEYGSVAVTIDEAVLKRIVDWLDRRFD